MVRRGWWVVALLVALGVLATGAVAVEEPTTDNTVTRITVHPDGNATWEIVVRTALETEADVEDYRAFQAAFRNDTAAYLDPFERRIRSTVANAENATGRAMTALNFSARTTIQDVPRQWGVVIYEFTWTQFAPVTDEELRVGDVFRGGYYLAENDILAITGPGTVTAVTPTPDERDGATVRWLGPRDFGDTRPAVTYADAGATSGGDAGSMPWPMVAAALLLVGAGAGVAYWYRTRSPTGDATGGVMTDEERVTALLAERGGRMKQADIADALDWSASKTSRVLSSLEEADAIERLRLGRENVVDLTED